MNNQNQQQKEKAIRYIFSCLQCTYGNSFINNFKNGYNDSDGVDTGLKTAHAFWLKKLSFFFDSNEGKNAIKEALNNLPIKPPNLIEFYELVKSIWFKNQQLYKQQLREKELKALQEKFTPEQVKQNQTRINNIIKEIHNMLKIKTKL